MATKAQIAFLKNHDAEIQEMIESRAAQKFFDEEVFVNGFWELATGFITHPSDPEESMRTMDEEDRVELLMDYAFGRFLREYAMSFIRMSNRVILGREGD